MNTLTLGRLRLWPFIGITLLSFCVAAGIGRERKPFAFNFSFATTDIVTSLGKVAHYESTALILLFATFALGHRKLRAAFILTMLVCAGWELAEATAAGHTARLADLAPDLVSAIATLVVIALVRYLIRFRRLTGLE